MVDEINCTWGSMWLCFLMIGVDEVVTQPTPTGRYPPSGLTVKRKSEMDRRVRSALYFAHNHSNR